MNMVTNYASLTSGQQTAFAVVAGIAAVLLIAGIITLCATNVPKTARKICGFVALGVAAALIAFDYSTVSGDSEANAMTSGPHGAVDTQYEVVDLVYDGNYVVDVVAEEQELAIGEDGILPDVRVSRDTLELEYGWIDKRIDLSYYSLTDRAKRVTTKFSTGKGNPKKGYEISDALDFPMWVDTWEIMKQLGLADDSAVTSVVPITDVDTEWLNQYMEEAYKAFTELSPEEEELVVRTTLTVDLFHKVADLDDHLRAMTEVPAAIKNNQWIIEEWIPLVDSWFVPDEDGNIIGYAAAYEYVPGHEGQPGYYQMKDEIRTYAGYAANMLKLGEWQGKRCLTSDVNWPLSMTGNDDERQVYREGDEDKQVTQLAYVFLYRDKNSGTTGYYGVDYHDRRREVYSFPKRYQKDEPEPEPEPEKKGGGGGGGTVIQTSTTSTTTTTTEKEKDPEETTTTTKVEAGKDSTQSSLVNGATNQGNGSNNPANGDGQVEDLVAANAGKVDRVTQDAQQQQQQNSQQQQQQQAVNDANKDLASAGINQSVGNVDSGKVGQDTVTPVINTADQNDGYVENNQQNNDQQNNQQQNNDQQNNQQQNNQQQNNNQQQPSGNTGKDQPAMGQVGKPQ